MMLQSCDDLNDNLRDVANLLGVHADVLVAELEVVPETDMDFDTYYASFIKSSTFDKTAMYQHVFRW